ncbi:undecaprenyl phosphate-alpha-L-ara4N flippase subunit ArnF [Erwinia toletana]|uniref:Probable 4-amino-4-deoxy-L-arabinose-phosphoundecaprenol flippase subunit ArnF n=1 Tax=Winslowiella toletana TaxID=92490 RepID=A0ABS4PFZ7_9GAMM|nr:4-amino-4-deoxy-L-arabinose-phosphoundecaprenol flippase subunit ArnF [Winslowiella toletana]MBP2171574.1 undecaprenyl phosphate-alpha-L-ara4N flippase subunit ArnF [Winslowiella toletana]
MTGYLLALCSVILVTAAQLMLRWSMVQIPDVRALEQWRNIPLQPLLVLAGGLIAYGLSMVFWLLTLKRMPLNRAYPLLSLSYVMVWLLAISLPAFAEPFHIGTLVGVILIMLGLFCIFYKPGKEKS